MTLKEILDVSRIPNRSRKDLELLLRDYDATCSDAIRHGREESARRSRSRASCSRLSLRESSRCKVVGSKPVPQGNYKAAEKLGCLGRSTRNPSGGESPQVSIERGRRREESPFVRSQSATNGVGAGDTVASQADANQAYTEAFRSYKGRNPTPGELLQVEHHTFGVSGDGRVGITHPRSRDGRPKEFYYLKRKCAQCGGRLAAACQKPVCDRCANVAGRRTFLIAPLPTTSNSSAPKQL